MEFSYRTRAANIAKMKSESFDLLVIGGGITGVGIARDAALRGLKVALVEKGDFASGTSSKSSKLIHGGLRYLEHGEFRLVFESLRERNLLRKKAPNLAAPLPILFPIYKEDKVGLFKLGLGMWLYDLLSLFRNIKFHRMFFKNSLLKESPLLLAKGLKGGFIFYDSFTHDARLTLEVAKSAQAEGAFLTTYVQIVGFRKDQNSKLAKACLKDQLSEEIFEVSAKHFINATGPWSDVTRQFSNPMRESVLRTTKGVHLVFKKAKLPVAHAFALQAIDGRLFFLIPWGEHLILGTTDTDYKESPDEAHATHTDTTYLLDSVNRYFPSHKLTLKDIISTYAGIRPLVSERSIQSSKDEYKISREHKIFKDAAGLLTIAGGKLTTYREMAKDVIDLISNKSCVTAQKDFASAMTDQEPTIEQSMNQEMVLTLSDYMMRRTSLFLKSEDQGVSKARAILPIMAEKLGWSEHRKETELSFYQSQIDHSKKYLL